MRRLMFVSLAAFTAGFGAASAAEPGEPGAKENANPCREEVSAALQKLRKSSWFRMDSNMLTENGPTNMTVEYVLPDKMHQTVTVVTTKQTSEVILVGKQAWGNEGKGWQVLPETIMQQVASQMAENVIEQQGDVGNYSCKGRTKFEGRDVIGYKLEDDPAKGTEGPKNEAFRMFYVDAMTGLPVSNVLLTIGREDKPFFKTSYSFPLDLKIEAPKDAAPAEAAKPDAPKSEAPNADTPKAGAPNPDAPKP